MKTEQLLQSLGARARQEQPPAVDVRAAVRRAVTLELPGTTIDWPLVAGAVASVVAAGIILLVSNWSTGVAEYPGVELVQAYESVLP